MIWNRNPTTTVFELVEELNKYLKWYQHDCWYYFNKFVNT
jgi:hypothetical protein